MSRRLAKTHWVALATLIAWSPAAAAAPAVIYLNFSDGTEALTRAENDNAALNQSALGAVTPYPAFTWPGIADGSISRRELVGTIAERVNADYQRASNKYQVTFASESPNGGLVVGVLREGVRIETTAGRLR